MRVVFCGGGTGGDVSPALTVAAARKSLSHEPLELLYIGVRGKIDSDLVAREGIPFAAVTARALRVGSKLGAAKGGLALAAGVGESLAALRRFGPDIVF